MIKVLFKTVVVALAIAAPLAPATALAKPKQVTVVITPKNPAALQRGLHALSNIQARRNEARIRQEGTDNSATVTQTGSGNTAGVFQRGRGHTANVTQDGNNNTIGVIQLGRNATANPVQTGDGRAQLIIQRGW
jgi:hypothetical protein